MSEGNIARERAATTMPSKRGFGSHAFAGDEGETLLKVLPRMRAASMQMQSNPSIRRHSSMSIPLSHGSASFANLEDLNPSNNRKGLLRRCSQDLGKIEETTAGASFWPAALVSVVMGVFSVVPYNMILASDKGSPQFISFVTHIFFVVINGEQFLVMFSGQRKIPMYWHAVFVALGFLFNTLKSDAFVRLPASMCMLLLNLQMLVGMIVQRLALGKHYSTPQLCGCGLVTAGVALAASAKGSSAASSPADAIPFNELVIGTSEMIGALLALTLLSLAVKAAFSQHGEHVGEQLFMQHLFGLPLFFVGGTWQHIGPRGQEWIAGGDWWKALLLLGNMALTFGDRKLSVQVVARAPNVLLVQLLDTVKKFLSMLLCALLAAPPLPPLGFWGGSLLLGGGTLVYLNASDAPEEDDDRDD